MTVCRGGLPVMFPDWLSPVQLCNQIINTYVRCENSTLLSMNFLSTDTKISLDT